MNRKLIEGIQELSDINKMYILRHIRTEIKHQSILWNNNKHYLTEWFTLVLKQIGQIAEVIIKNKSKYDLTHQIFQAITLLLQMNLGKEV